MIYVPHLQPDPYSALQGAEEGLVQTLGYQVVTQYQLNGITVALLSIGAVSG